MQASSPGSLPPPAAAASGSVAANAAGNVTKTVAFKTRLPDVYVGPTHFRRGLRSLRTIKPDLAVRNLRNRQRKLTASSLDALTKGLTVPITMTLRAYYRLFHHLHPFEATVADLVVQARVKRGEPSLSDIMAGLKALRAATGRTGKHYAHLGAEADSAVEAKALLEEGQEELRKLYCGEGEGILTAAQEAEDLKRLLRGEEDDAAFSGLHLALSDMVTLQKELRRIPVLELDTQTCVLVGTPNVGKSTLVRALSTGTPEVNDYPFTTRSVTIGHVVVPERELRFQVMDTPGLLDRPAVDRNEMENLTFASLLHLPTAVIFVIDPSGLSGDHHSSLQAQLAVREMLREQFPQRPWLDVVSKADLDVPQSVLDQLPRGHLQVSVHDGTNMQELREKMEKMLTVDLQALLQERDANKAAGRDEEKIF